MIQAAERDEQDETIELVWENTERVDRYRIDHSRAGHGSVSDLGLILGHFSGHGRCSGSTDCAPRPAVFGDEDPVATIDDTGASPPV